MNSEEIKSHEDEELSAADEVEEEADDLEEDDEEEDMEEEEPLTAAELLHEAAVRILESPVYSADPPLEITEEDIAEIPDIPSPSRAAFFISAAEQNLHLTALQGKAARHMEKLKYLQEANRAKRCEHVKADGESCAGPAL